MIAITPGIGLERHGIAHRVFRFQGGHEIPEAALRQLMAEC